MTKRDQANILYNVARSVMARRNETVDDLLPIYMHLKRTKERVIVVRRSENMIWMINDEELNSSDYNILMEEKMNEILFYLKLKFTRILIEFDDKKQEIYDLNEFVEYNDLIKSLNDPRTTNSNPL